MPSLLHLLLVDDDPFVREVLSAALAGVYTLSVAGSGADALACLVAQRPDLVLSDYLLPDGPAVPLLREADRIEVPAVVMTGHPAVIELLDGGTRPLLVKPFGLAGLHLALERAAGTLTPA